jgi:hypothetical protein
VDELSGGAADRIQRGKMVAAELFPGTPACFR